MAPEQEKKGEEGCDTAIIAGRDRKRDKAKVSEGGQPCRFVLPLCSTSPRFLPGGGEGFFGY